MSMKGKNEGKTPFQEEKEKIDANFEATWDFKKRFIDLECVVYKFSEETNEEEYGEYNEEYEEPPVRKGEDGFLNPNFPSVTLATQDFFGEGGEEYYKEGVSATFLFRIPKNYPKKCCQYVKMKSSNDLFPETSKKIMKYANSNIHTKNKLVIFDILLQTQRLLQEQSQEVYEEKGILPKSPEGNEILNVFQDKMRKKKKKKKKKNPNAEDAKKPKNIIFTNEVWEPEAKKEIELEESRRAEQLLDNVSIPLQVKQFSRLKVQHLPHDEFKVYIHISNASNFFKAYSDLHREFVEKKVYDQHNIPKDNNWERHLFLDRRVENLKPKMNVHESKHPSDIFRRAYYCCESHNDNIYIFGGENERGLLNDFVRINVENRRVDVFRSLYDYSMKVSNYQWNASTEYGQRHAQIPGMSKGQMKIVEKGLLIMSSNRTFRKERATARQQLFGGRVVFGKSDQMMFYYIDKINTDRPVYGLYESGDRYNQWIHPEVEVHSSVDYVPMMEEFSATKIGHADIWIFGGRRQGGSCNKNLYKIEFRKSQNRVVCTESIKPDTLKNRKRYTTVYRSNEKKDDDDYVEDDVVVWPLERFSHAAVAVYNNLYIFGGRSVKGENLNDLFMFSIDHSKWTEIRCSFIPPPISRFGYYSMGVAGFTIYGGGLPDGKSISQTVYTFYFRDQKWVVSNINMKANNNNDRSSIRQNFTEENSNDDNSNPLAKLGTGEFPICDLSQELGKGRLMVGGRKKNGSYSDDVTLFLSPSDPGRNLSLLEYLETQRKEKFLCDVLFRCKIFREEPEESETKKKEEEEEEMGDEIGETYGHLCVIFSRCEKFGEFILSNGTKMKKSDVEDEGEDQSTVGGIKNNDLYVVEMPPNTRMKVLEAWMRFLYTGNLVISGCVEDFLSFVKEFSPDTHYPIIRKLCSKQRRYLDSCQIILDQITKDFAKLQSIEVFDNDEAEEELLPPPFFDPTDEDEGEGEEDRFNFLDQPPATEENKKTSFGTSERKKEEYFADLKIHFSPDEPCLLSHSLFLCRSKYFKAMLQSQFRESIEREIHFSEYNKVAVRDIFHYLYTDELRMNPSNCVGVLIYSLQFEILEISSYCRRIVNEYLNNSNVIELINIAELYCDKTLKWICERYLVKHYEDISLTSDFNEMLENETRNRITRDFLAKQKRKESKMLKMRNKQKK